MHIASHNVRTLSTDSLLDVYLQQLEKIKADIIGVCETRRARAVSARWTSGEEILLGEGANNVPRTGGVGFIIKAKMVPYIISCDIISPRVAVLKVKLQKLGNRTLKMVQVYAPTVSAEDDEIERFYEEIETALKLKSTYTIVQGDFNAVVGSRLDDTEYLIGRYGAGVRNDRGNRLIEFAEQHQFSIMNTFFEKKAKRLWTWRSSDTRTLRQIDYVLTDTPRLFADVSVIGENVITTGSDHRLLRSVILFDAKKERRVLHSQKNTRTKNFQCRYVGCDDRVVRSAPYALKDDTGVRTTNRPRMNEICTKFYSGLYSSKVVVAGTYRTAAEEPIPEMRKRCVPPVTSKAEKVRARSDMSRKHKSRRYLCSPKRCERCAGRNEKGLLPVVEIGRYTDEKGDPRS
ncbi:endonuclease/exonuclease/phosphatase family protein [Ostertagia ostertagi]